MTVTPASRPDTLAALAGERFDVLVVGGGITGAGIARDAALRGLRTALVERDDFAAGTSSRSSRLVHGGVRYLEHGHLGLVFEASRERRVLLQTAPHLVRPLAFTWPVYRGARVPRWKLEAGLALYDALALFRNVGLHRPLRRTGVLRREPALRTDGLLGGSSYYDASTDDARLTLATALGARDGGAVVCNHVEVRGALFERGGAVVTVVDTLGGATLDVRARVVVNATGPWSDVVPGLGDPDGQRVLGSKGAHVAVPAERLGNRGAVTMLSPVDGRVMFVLPSANHALSIIGTTETPAEGGPDEVRASESDVEYLLRSANGFFPDARLGRDDVVAAWAGIRPLAATRAGPGGEGTSSASREHVVERDPRGLVTVSGGKLTTYRAMAADAVDAVGALLGHARVHPRTATLPLPGGDVPSMAVVESEAAQRVGDPAIGVRLARAYGGDWPRVWGLVDRDPRLARHLVPGLPYIAAELVHAVTHEQGATLADLLVRRVPLAFETRDAGRAAARAAATVVAPLLGWDSAAVTRALDDYDREAARLFAVD